MSGAGLVGRTEGELVFKWVGEHWWMGAWVGEQAVVLASNFGNGRMSDWAVWVHCEGNE